MDLPRDGIATDTQAHRRIVLATMRMLERGLDQRRFKLTSEGIHHFRLACSQ
ncbi:hypothetical protein D3C75_1346070 [compost metagenome]